MSETRRKQKYKINIDLIDLQFRPNFNQDLTKKSSIQA
jgi:hypothetical protein